MRLRVELKRLVADESSGIDKLDCKVLLEWLLVASQSTSNTECSPAVQMVVSVVQTDCEVFANWAYYRLESTLGSKCIKGQAPQRALHNNKTAASVWAIQVSAESVQRLAAQQHRPPTGPTQLDTTMSTKADSTAFSQYSLAAQMGWCHVYTECDVPPIWARLLTTKDMGDQRAIMMAAMNQLADAMRMEFDNRVYFSDKTAEAVVKLQPNPGDAIPNFASAGKRLSILACRPKTMAEMEDEGERAAAE